MVAQNDLLRVIELQGTVAQLIVRGKRDPAQVAEVLQVVNDHADFAERLGLAPREQPKDVQEAIREDLALWAKFDREVFGVIYDPAALLVPQAPDADFRWPIVIPEGMTMNRVIATMRDAGLKVLLYTEELDRDVSENDRAPKNGAYVVLVRAREEADEELANRSADELKTAGISGTTLLEQLRLVFFYWWKTGGKKRGKYLDVKNWTLCEGSRYSGGDVPSVYWDPIDQAVYVSWTNRHAQNPDLRARAVRS